MTINNKSKFDTIPLMLLLAKRESPTSFLDLDSAIYGRWESLKEESQEETRDLPPAKRKEKEMLNQVIEWLSIANELQRQRESEK